MNVYIKYCLPSLPAITRAHSTVTIEEAPVLEANDESHVSALNGPGPLIDTTIALFAMAFYRSPILASAFPIASVSDKVDSAKSAVKATVNSSKPPTGADLYARFAFAGAVCCAVTHGALTPVDVVKTRIQLEPEVYNKGMVTGFRQVIANEGAGALLTGLGPTVLGYALQGAFKFGGYEFWKKTFIDAIGIDAARENRQAIYLASSGIAEFFADIALCPLEATRIRLVSQPTFANGLLGGFARIAKEEGLRGFYSGFGPILFKQVPYTMAKFAVYEVVFEKAVQATGKPKSELSTGTLSALNLGSGLMAGFAAAVISQPADTLLSKINKTKGLPGESISSRLIKMARDLGPGGLFTGMGARLVMIGTLTAGQFAIYSDIKRVLGATGGVEIAKVQTS
ncbi:inorganic phosphate transporter [Rhizoctonia solani AG-1 IA]|uniref:Inorganic phosphate transporter n=2 Tax=Rhizoctonia solani TaxID=456999 RepID=L8X6Y0_THACA|nr:inorganic phosphate transporter [Rhizoctonia solani AG-1 IA]